MAKDLDKLISDFISDIHQQYPKLVIWVNKVGFDFYEICHDYPNEETDSEFHTNTGNLFYDYFVEKKVYNVCFGYSKPSISQINQSEFHTKYDKVGEA